VVLEDLFWLGVVDLWIAMELLRWFLISGTNAVFLTRLEIS
jgi:hypothetical protein